MKLKKLRAALQERPWLVKCFEQITGTHAYHVQQSGEDWNKHVETWAARNISEIAERPWSELNLDERAEFKYYSLGIPDEKVTHATGYGWRRHEGFTHTRYFMFNQSTHEAKYALPYAFCWSYSTIYDEGGPQTVRENLLYQRRPHYVGRPETKIEVPFVFNALVRVTQVGIRGRCSSTIIDIFPFPADFDFASLS